MRAATVAILVAKFVGPLNLNTVVIAALIVLMPGMSLTNAVNELTSQNLISGTARFAGAISTMHKLTVGTMIALTAAQVLGVDPQVRALRPQPAWVEWGALLTGVLAFAVLRSEECRVGKECVRTCRSRWEPEHSKKKK